MSKWVRILAFVLCLSFVFSFIARPMSVSANAGSVVEDLVTVGFAGITYQMGWGLAIIFAIIVAMGIADVHDLSFEQVAALAEDWYADADAADLRYWLEVLGPSAVQAKKAFELTPEVQAYLRWQANFHGVTLPATIDWIVLPADYTTLDTLTLADAFGIDVHSSIVAGNTISLSIQSALNDLKASVISLPGTIEQSFIELKEWSMDTHATTSQFLRNVDEMTSAVNNNVVKFGRDTVDWLKVVNSNTVTYAQRTITAISTMSDVIGSKIDDLLRVYGNGQDVISGKIDELASKLGIGNDVILLKLDELIKRMEKTFTGTIDVIAPGYAGTVDQVITAENALKQSSDEGRRKFYISLQHGKDLLRKYSAAFLALAAVLNMFLNLPVVGELAQFGLALGIFALLVGLGNTIVAHEAAEDRAFAKKQAKVMAVFDKHYRVSHTKKIGKG